MCCLDGDVPGGCTPCWVSPIPCLSCRQGSGFATVLGAGLKSSPGEIGVCTGFTGEFLFYLVPLKVTREACWDCWLFVGAVGYW